MIRNDLPGELCEGPAGLLPMHCTYFRDIGCDLDVKSAMQNITRTKLFYEGDCGDKDCATSDIMSSWMTPLIISNVCFKTVSWLDTHGENSPYSQVCHS